MLHALKQAVPQGIKNLYHWALALLACRYYGFPGRRLKVIGVTGTNGKTTTVQFVTAILEAAGHRVAMASTINFQVGERRWINKTKFTTLSSWAVQRFLHEAAEAGCQYAVLETSSHALDQHRVWGIPYAVGVLTNVTREHLDYHRTMARYRDAKKKLFRAARISVLNADMESPDEFARAASGRYLFYSTLSPQAGVYAENIEETIEGSAFSIGGTPFTLRVPGRFNIENALAAVSVGLTQNIPLPVMAGALAKIDGVPGRLEQVPNDRGLTILVDYAVTPDSLDKLYTLVGQMRRAPDRKTIAILGACGERDRGKRPIMGEIVASRADIVILTNEDPYHEDPERILDEIAAGLGSKKLGTDYFRILDRRQAIRQALHMAESGDTLVVTGKGAEETMAIGSRRVKWNDRRVIEEELNQLRKMADHLE